MFADKPLGLLRHLAKFKVFHFVDATAAAAAAGVEYIYGKTMLYELAGQSLKWRIHCPTVYVKPG